MWVRATPLLVVTYNAKGMLHFMSLHMRSYMMVTPAWKMRNSAYTERQHGNPRGTMVTGLQMAEMGNITSNLSETSSDG